MNFRHLLLCGVLILSAGVVALATPEQKPPKAALQKETKETNGSTDAQAGEQKFLEHCARCHKPPEALPRAAVPAVLRHMRIRANLSARDEQDILHFMAP
jgi:cytochrome c2